MSSIKKEKIVILVDAVDQMGGTRAFLFQLLNIHVNQKIPTVLAIQAQQLDSELKEYCTSRNISLIKLPGRHKIFYEPFLSLIYDVYTYLYLILKINPSLIFASIGSPGLFHCLFFFNTPLIYFLHTTPVASGYQARIINFFVRRFVNYKKSIATVSHYSKNKISKEMGINEQFIDVIFNSIKTPDNIESRRSSRIILTVGHVINYKNPYLWYEVAKQVIKINQETKFYWVGEGPLLLKMKNKIKRDKLDSHIIFTGYKNNVNEYYQQAEIYFHPSLVESHGISIIEAMSYKLPCVASNTGGIKESIISKEYGVLCEPNDKDSFIRNISCLLDNHDYKCRIGKKGRKFVMEKFSESVQEKAFLSLYDKKLHHNND